MKIRGLTLLPVVVVAVLAIGNPGLGDFATYATDRLESAPNMAGFFAGLMPGLTRSYVLSHTTRRNFGVFSVYRLDPGHPHALTAVGLLWHFYGFGDASSKVAPSPN